MTCCSMFVRMRRRRRIWHRRRCRRCATMQEFFVLSLFLDLVWRLWILPLHVLQLRRRQLAEMSNEAHELPTVLVVLIALFAPRRHAREADAVLDDVIQLAIGPALSVIEAHVCRFRIQVL